LPQNIAREYQNVLVDSTTASGSGKLQKKFKKRGKVHIHHSSPKGKIPKDWSSEIKLHVYLLILHPTCRPHLFDYFKRTRNKRSLLILRQLKDMIQEDQRDNDINSNGHSNWGATLEHLLYARNHSNSV
jgi:hypothetical protein